MNNSNRASSFCRPQKIEGENQLNKSSNRSANARREKIKRKSAVPANLNPITEAAQAFVAMVESLKDRCILDEMFDILQRRRAEEVDAHATADALFGCPSEGCGEALYKALALCHGKPLGGKHGNRAAKSKARNKGGIK